MNSPPIRIAEGDECQALGFDAYVPRESVSTRVVPVHEANPE